MKTTIALVILIMTINIGMGQNLVPNAGFEAHDSCPNNEDQVQYASGWFKVSQPITTPDYYNFCSPSNSLGVPQSGVQFQSDLRSCGAYMGLVTYDLNLPDYREQVGILLPQPLVIGQKYYISFSTVRGGHKLGSDYYDHPSNNIGIRLSTVAYSPSNPAPIDNYTHLRSVAIINDTVNWIKISGSIIADSAYAYVMLGNFYNDANTDTLLLSCSTCYNFYSYYIVDNICVSTDSTYCNGGVDSAPCINFIRELNDENKIIISPNPANDVVNISFNEFQYGTIQITDLFGEAFYYEEIKNKDATNISLSSFPAGIYFLRFTNQKDQKMITKKIVKL